MAPMETSRRKDDDDFVLTISDNDDNIPGIEDEDDSDSTPATPSTTSRKRGRDEELQAANGLKAKKVKKQKHVAQATDASEEEANSTKPVSNEDMDSDFEFNLGESSGDIVEDGFDGWNLNADLRSGAKQPFQKGVDLDAIIARRREQAKAAEESGDEDEENPDENPTPNAYQNEGDEMLEDDVFGVGAEDRDEDGSAQDEKMASDDESEDMDNAQGDNESNSDSADDEETAAPVTHPDDDIGEDSDEKEDPAEVARRAAFFAPEETEPSPKDVSKTSDAFQSMSLSRPILKGLASIGFTSATPIQVKTVPVALQGKDVVGGAVTGSGKTAAFVIPILERLLYRPKKVATTRVGILMPTRELAVQCFNVATKLAAFTDITLALIVGGLSVREQEQTLKKRPDVVIATPGRFIDHMRNSASFAVENLEILVLDEADRMLEDGFADELNEILSTIPKSRQTMLFSATMTEDVDKLIRVGLNRPVRLMVDAKKQTVQELTQEFIKMKSDGGMIDEDRRLAYLLHLCKTMYTAKTIVFFPRKVLAHRVKVLFAINGIKASELHGSMSQEQRLSAISSFREGECTHLLATDLASRGLDIPRVETVINFTVPPTTTTYLHRVGRTARAGRSGVSCTLFSPIKEKEQHGKESGKQTLERTLLRPILKLAKSQHADMRTRSLPASMMNELTVAVRASQAEIDAILLEEKEERLFQQTERDVTKGENLVKYEQEIASRPKRTWFQTEKDKKEASKRGVDEHLGVNGSRKAVSAKKDKKKLSGKDKRRLMDKDERREGKSQGWKKGKDERMGKGVLQQTSNKSGKRTQSKPSFEKSKQSSKTKTRR